MIYETLGADAPATKPDTSGIATGVLNVTNTLINAIAQKKQQEREADTLQQLEAIRAERLALESELAQIQSGGMALSQNDMLLYGGIAVFALIAILLISKKR